jgi:hypothetical protein
VTERTGIQRIAESMIRRAGRQLPDSIRDERYREWTAELPAILRDPEIRVSALRQARALRYAAGVYRSARQLGRAAGQPRSEMPAGWASRSQRRRLERPRLPGGVIPAVAAVIIQLSDIVLVRAFPPHGSPDYPVLAASIAASVLGVVAIVRFVRWLRRRSRGLPRR